MASAKGKKKNPSIKIRHALESLGNAPARAGEIRVERLEKRLRPKVPFPHRHDFYHLLFVEKGGGWHEIDFARFKIKPNQIFVMRPGQVHAWRLSPRTKGYVLEFTRESLGEARQADLLQRGADESPAMLLSARAKAFASILRIMLEEFDGQGPGFRASLEHLLCVFLLKLAREARTAPVVNLPRGVTEEFKALVEKNFSRQHKVEEYARALGLTPKALTTQVSRALGKSAGTLIQERCLVEAKRLLTYSDLTVAEVGEELGYEDPNYFARFFRKNTGISPGKFRRLATRMVHA